MIQAVVDTGWKPGRAEKSPLPDCLEQPRPPHNVADSR